MHRYVVEVTVASHNAVKAGTVAQPRCPGARPWHRVIVSAESDQEAVMVAAQIASATSDGGMCTSAIMVDFPAPA